MLKYDDMIRKVMEHEDCQVSFFFCTIFKIALLVHTFFTAISYKFDFLSAIVMLFINTVFPEATFVSFILDRFGVMNIGFEWMSKMGLFLLTMTCLSDMIMVHRVLKNFDPYE